MGVISRYKKIKNNFYFNSRQNTRALIDTEGVDFQVATLSLQEFDLLFIDGKKATWGVIDGDRYSFSSFDNLLKVQIILFLHGLSLDDEDLLFLSNNENIIFNEIQNASMNKNRFIEGIARQFTNIKENIEKNNGITDAEYAFYTQYSKIPEIKSLPVTSEIRILIVKYRGESSFIKEQFAGLEDFFSLEQFQERLDDEIRKFIDSGVEKGESWTLTTNDVNEDNLVTISSDPRFNDGKPTLSWITEDLYLENVLLEEGKLRYTKVGVDLAIRTGWTGKNSMTTKIPFSDIKFIDGDTTTQIYEEPTIYDKVNFFKRPSTKVDFYPEVLKKYYDPTVEVGAFLWFFDEPSITGPQQTVFGAYLKFIDIFSDDANFLDNGQLKKRIGEFEEEILSEAFDLIVPKLFAFQENLVRFNLAKLVSQKKLDELKDLSPEDALNIAQTAADLNLQGMQGDLDGEELTEEDIQQRTQLYKQCVLILNSKDLNSDHLAAVKSGLDDSSNSMHNASYYNNRFYMIGSKGDNLSIKNKLISPSGKKIKPFLEITPDIASALKPRLRLYKVYNDGEKSVSFEFPFPAHTSKSRVDAFNGDQIDRGDGVGIKSFNFSFDGETPATSQQYISADLSLFFQTFSDFVKLRKAPEGNSEGKEENFRYADLFVNTKYCPKDISKVSPLNYDPSHYRLRVDVGWEPRNDGGFEAICRSKDFNADEFNEALMAMNKSFYLNLIDHEINISESGTVTISANYIAYIEGLMENNNALLSKEAKALQEEFVGKYEQELNKGNCDPKVLSELKASINAIRISSRKMLHQSLVEKLVKNNCMYYTQVRSRDRREFARNKFFTERPKLKNRNTVSYLANLNENKNADSLKTAEDINSNTTTENYKYIMNNFVSNTKPNNMERISFFYMSDLVYFLLDPIYYDGEPEEQIKIILSSFDLNVPFSDNVNMNIGQIPIEIEVFTKWYKNEIIDKELDSISFLEFIKRLTFYLITDVFSEVCIDEQQHKRLSFMNAAINSVKKKGKGTLERLLKVNFPITDINVSYNRGELPLQTSALNQEKLKPSDFVQYLLIYPHHRPDGHVGRAKAVEDARRGVHHLYIGSNKGILKNASFSKTDIQYLRESRMLTQGENGLLQLSSLYRTNIKMIGNTIFYPGMLLYLNPFGFGGMDFGLPHQGPGTVEEPNLSNIMGIGGYQKVVKVSSTISESGKFETDVECIFEHTGEPGVNSEDKKSGRSPTAASGRGQQDIRRITCKDLDKVDKNAKACAASDYSRDLQNELLNLNRNGSIDSREEE